MSVNEKMTAIADAIRAKTGGTESLTLDAMATEIPKIYEEGKKAERDEFWETFQKGGVPMNYNYAFAFNKFKDENYFPKYNINVASGNTTANYMFTSSPDLTDTKVTIDASNAKNTQNMFSGCTSLKKIPKLIVGANTTFANTFSSCEALEELYIEGTIAKNGLNLQWSTLLTHDSLMSIINALADKSADTSGTEWIVTLGDENKAKLTDSELAIAENRGWTVK